MLCCCHAVSVLCGSLLSPLQSHAQLPAAQLHNVFPAGARAGTSVEIRVDGADLDGLTGLHASDPRIVAEPILDSEHNPLPDRFNLRVAEEMEPGIYDIRAVGRYGISNPRAFMVSDLPEQAESGSNHRPQEAQPVPLDSWVNGRADAEAIDYFSFDAREGQRLLVECWAQRIDSKMDATLILLDPDGKEIARSRDAIGADPLIDRRITSSGRHTLMVHDFLYRGGSDYVYRFRAGTGPHLDFVVPPAGLPGTTQRFTLFGRNLPGGTESPLRLADGTPLDALEIELELPKADAWPGLPWNGYAMPQSAGIDGIPFHLKSGHGASNPISIGRAEAPVRMEVESNDARENAQRLSLPVEVAGNFFPGSDSDWFEFDIARGESFWIEVFSERMGCSTDPQVILERADDPGKLVVQHDDIKTGPGGREYSVANRDLAFRFAPEEPGRYRLLLRNLFSGQTSQPDHVYRLCIRPARPDFRLVTFFKRPWDNNKEVALWPGVLRRGGTTVLNVGAIRRDGFAGPIELEVTGLPESVSAAPARLDPGVDETRIVLSAAADAAAWSGPIQVTGRARIGDDERVSQAVEAVLGWTIPNYDSEPIVSRLTRGLTLSVVDADPSPIDSIMTGEIDGSLESSLAAELEIPIRITKRYDSKGKLKVSVTGFPGLKKAPAIELEEKASDAALKIDFRKRDGNQFEPGTYPVQLIADGQFQYRRNPEAIERAREDLARIEQRHEQAETASAKAAEFVGQARERAGEANAAVEAARRALDAAMQAAAKTAAAVAEAEAEAVTVKARVDEAAGELAAARDRVKKAEEASKPSTIRWVQYAPPIPLVLRSSPVTLAPGEGPVVVAAGGKATLPIRLERRFGFDGAVTVTCAPSDSADKIKTESVQAAPEIATVAIPITCAADTVPGEYVLTVKAAVQFNGEDLETEGHVRLKVVD